MSRRASILFFLAALCMGVLRALAPSASAAAPAPTTRYIVTLHDAAVTGDRNVAARSLATQLTAIHGGTVDLVYGSALFGFAATMTPAQAKAMAGDARVRAVEPDAPVRTMQPARK